jgi:hypothetical protein
MTDYTTIIPHKNIPHLLQRCLDSISEHKNIKFNFLFLKSYKKTTDFIQ